MVRSWLLNKNQPHLLSRWNDRLAQLPPKEAIYGNIIRRRVDEREYIATYPEFVTLLGMVADPDKAQLRDTSSIQIFWERTVVV